MDSQGNRHLVRVRVTLVSRLLREVRYEAHILKTRPSREESVLEEGVDGCKNTVKAGVKALGPS